MEGLVFCSLGVFEDGRLFDTYVKMMKQMVRYNYLYIHMLLFIQMSIYLYLI